MTEELRTIFMGTPRYVLPSLEVLYKETNLQAIFTGADRRGGRGNKLIVPAPKDFAILHNIPFYQPINFKNNTLVNKSIEEIKPDIIFVNAYGFIIPKSILDIPNIASINLHASLLPIYRGASPIQSAILNGDVETGISVQIMSDKLDAGDIVYIEKIPIKEEEDYISLSFRLSILAAQCMKKTIELYKKGEVLTTKQNDGDASYCKKIKKEDGLINWDSTYLSISRKIRAYINWPKSYTYYRDRKLIINKIDEYKKVKLGEEAGEIIEVNKKEGILVQCKDSTLRILSLKPEGKKSMDYKSFLNGHPLEKGEVLSMGHNKHSI